MVVATGGYYHNFSVHKASNTRTYYGGVPDVIQVSQHYFMDSALLDFFAMGKALAHISSFNCARIYNTSMATRYLHILNHKLAYTQTYDRLRHRLELAAPWQYSLELGDEYVLNGFLLYALLVAKAEQSSTLVLPHNASSQRERLKEALAERNKQMQGTGQEEYTHACDLCFVVSKDEAGNEVKVQAAVCDGDTIGHPCCAKHDCKNPLVSHQHRFCAEHDALNQQCSVIGCSAPHLPTLRTCADPSHQRLEEVYFQRGNAMFQLKNRLRKANEENPLNADKDDQGFFEMEVPDCSGKPEHGNRKLKAYFGRRRMHNEQIIMRPCGVILSRATFFGSEAISADFAKATFPTKESACEFFIFDNNCKLIAHHRAIGEDHWFDTAFPVDVFHFRTKHKQTDHHCQRNCNPAAFPELMKDGKWLFNTSICEQTNVWLGGYQSILADMEVTRYNFYLDEMIKLRNRYVVRQLERQGHRPWSIPVSTLFPSN